MEEYLQDTVDAITKTCIAAPSESEFRAIYKASLATFSPLVQIARRKLPLLKTAAGIVKRCPLLIASAQLQLAYVDLRRLIEVSTCYPFFAEHPIEWTEFAENPGDGYEPNQELPIRWAAHRELRWYSNYVRERYQQDRSGLIEEAISANKMHYKEFSRYVHAALDHMTKKPLTEVFDPVDAAALKKYRTAQREVLRSAIVLACAPDPAAIGKLGAIERAWFDWNLGPARQKAIRAGKFLT